MIAGGGVGVSAAGLAWLRDVGNAPTADGLIVAPPSCAVQSPFHRKPGVRRGPLADRLGCKLARRFDVPRR